MNTLLEIPEENTLSIDVFNNLRILCGNTDCEVVGKRLITFCGHDLKIAHMTKNGKLYRNKAYGGDPDTKDLEVLSWYNKEDWYPLTLVMWHGGEAVFMKSTEDSSLKGIAIIVEAENWIQQVHKRMDYES